MPSQPDGQAEDRDQSESRALDQEPEAVAGFLDQVFHKAGFGGDLRALRPGSVGSFSRPSALVARVAEP